MTNEHHNYRRDLKGHEYCHRMQYIRGWSILSVPTIDSGNLVWEIKNYGEDVDITGEKMAQILAEFMMLENAPDDEILKFVRKWGVLGICEHELPSTHILRPAFEEGIGYLRCNPQQRSDGLFFEPLESWRKAVIKVKALNNLIAYLYEGKRGDQKDWQVFSSWVKCPVETDTLTHERFQLSLLISRLLELTDLRPQFWWGNDRLIFTIAHPPKSESSLFATLITWVALKHNFPDRYSICSSCGVAIQLGEGQSIWRKHYCEDCGVKAVWREASKRYRQKERENPARAKRKRLTEEQVRAIRQRIDNRKDKRPLSLSYDLFEQLATEYRVSISTIYKIAEGRIWKQIE